MAKNVVIVESPAKAKTIEGYLGKDYHVLSSFGHVRDLPKKGLAIDVENNFEPTYEISPDKKKTMSNLKKAAKAAETVWLASDEDREGEAIAWHLAEALSLKEDKAKRITFHEITKSAIESAIQQPRAIDKQLVDSQQARRVLDRLVGYELSPLLWRKVRPGLSAGRVQSVAVRLLVEREREIRDFQPETTFKITGEVKTVGGELLPVEAKEKLKDAKSAKGYLEALSREDLKITAIDKSPGTKRPSPPFTTSTLQQEAARKLGYPVRYTMRLAQDLYEAGLITYMRTDSMNMAEAAIGQAERVVTEKYGKEYANPTRYKTKSKGAQEAHEAIRPTDFAKDKAGDSEPARKLYALIRRRALASQMQPAKIERTTVTLQPKTQDIPLIAKGEILVFPGWLKLGGSSDDVILPELKVGEDVHTQQLVARETFSKPPARYSESSLVRKLEELGIGRPSTFAPTISTIQDRGYVEKTDLEGQEREASLITLTKAGKIEEETDKERYGADRGKLIPTPTGEQVTDFLVEHFPDVIDYDFTAEVEEGLDHVATGERKWQDLIALFYSPFHKAVEDAATVKRSEAAQARLIGEDPKTGKPIYARYGRYGPMLQRGETEEENKPDFAPLPPGERIETVSLEGALKAFSLPKTLGKTDEEEEIIVMTGRYGPYLKVGSKNISLRNDDPYKITLKRAKEVISEHEKQEADRYIARFEKEGIDIINGRYGPYITDGKKNARVPKDKKPQDIKVDEAKELLAKAPDKKGRRKKRRR